MVIYHGSENIISTPIYGRGSNANDYGRGFYCTESIEVAKEWACKRNTDGFVNAYELDLKGISVCNLNDDKYHILNWLALLTKYRGYWQRKSLGEEAKNYLQEHYLIDISGFDIVIGYRADDSYFSFAQDFIMGTISLQKLSNAMHLGKLGEQVVLKSERAFNMVKHAGFEEVSAEEYYVKKVTRDNRARQEYSELKSSLYSSDEIFMIDILRGSVKEDELRI